MRGDAHVYGTPSRFLTPGVLGTIHRTVWPPETAVSEPVTLPRLPRVDVAAELKKRWA